MRVRIPSSIQKQVLYDSAYACAICAKPTVQVHHIDQDAGNNDPSNLIVLCQEHHGEAHTSRKLTVSLSKDKLTSAKKKWEKLVYERRQKIATVGFQRSSANQFLSVGITWGYINHRQVAKMLRPSIMEHVNQQNFELCKSRRLVDETGFLIVPRTPAGPANYLNNSVYDNFDHGDDHRVHKLYCDLVDGISSEATPVHIFDESFRKGWINQFVATGQMIFINRGHYFKELQDFGDNKVRLAYCQKGKVRFEYIVETKDMFGVSSMTVSFTGRKTASALVLVKSVDEHDGKLVVSCTPIAMGAGAWLSDPTSAAGGWDNDGDVNSSPEVHILGR